jgi:hypothetical protein
MPTSLNILRIAEAWPEWAQEELAQLARELEAEVNAGTYRLPPDDFDRFTKRSTNRRRPTSA